MADSADRFLQDLKQAIEAGSADDASAAIQAIRMHVAEMRSALQHGEAHGLLSDACEIAAQVPAARAALSREMALNLGARVELLMSWTDLFGVVPDETLLERTESDLDIAISFDPSVPDLHWDVAVVAARFRGSWDKAAAKLAEAQKLGYRHPMVPLLQAKIAERRLPGQEDTGQAQLSRLILHMLAMWCGPERGWLFNEEETPGRSGPPISICDFTADAIKAVRERPLEEAQWDALLDRAQRLPGDPQEIVMDLIRRTAEGSSADPSIVIRTTTMHLSILLAQAQDLLQSGERTHEGVWYRRARKAATRALKIAAVHEVAPNLHAEIFLARGSAQWRMDTSRGADVLADYRQALKLKRKAGKKEDCARLIGMIWQQIDARLHKLMGAKFFGGVGGAYAELAAFADAVDELDDPARALQVKFDVAAAERELGMREDAEIKLRSIIAATTDPELHFSARFELSSILSETRRPAEAAQLQEQLIAEKEPDVSSTLWGNYANSLLLLRRLDEASAVAEKAWVLHEVPKPSADGGQPVDLHGANIRTIQAQIAHKAGDLKAALAYAEEALRLNTLPMGLDGLHMFSLTAPVLFEAGRHEQGLQVIDKADDALARLLKTQPDLRVWEAMLRDWSRLDALAVRSLIQHGGGDFYEKALLRAEAAKGRVHAWFENVAHPEAGAIAFDRTRLQKGLDRVRAWMKTRPGRSFLSLFATDDGLAVFSIAASGSVSASWLEDVRYGRLNQELFEPWERLVQRAMDGAGGDSLPLASAVTEHLLERIGSALECASPALAQGGSALAISPHRLFRNLPLAHARLSGGKRLSDLFDEVVVIAGLASLRDAAEVAPPGAMVALGDPDESLPFARIETLTVGGAGAAVGKAVGREALNEALHNSTQPVLLSTHAWFDAANPFHSYLVASDGKLALHEFIGRGMGRMAPVVVLGACEAGKSRRSISDEPFGFPVMLLDLGCREVAAPSWKVDDFASFVFLTDCCARVADGVALPQAIVAASKSMRNMTPAAALERLDAALAQAQAADLAGWAERSGFRQKVDALRRWLNKLSPADRPFHSPLDWASFQVSVRALS